jgi:NAD-dependent dihydropyrimidine dehydrogenase PreA subunit
MVTKEEVSFSLKEMMRNVEETVKTDKVYKFDMKGVGVFKVQWKIRGIKGYQIFEKDNYSYKFEEEIDDPDVTLFIRDLDLANKFLRQERFETTFTRGYKGAFKILHTAAWKIIDTDTGKSRVRISKPFLTTRFNPKQEYSPLILMKLPMFRRTRSEEEREERGEEYGSYVPINQSLGTFENQVLPYKVFKHFIDRASNIIFRDCPCRVNKDCQDHDKSLGCMFMGDDTLKVVIPETKGRVATKEEALERVRLAIDDGLIPLLGRAVGETEGYGIKDTGHFLATCFCCSCCCINGRMISYGTVGTDRIYQRIEGLTVEVDPSKCVGCGKCLEVCVFKGRELVNGKAHVDPVFCLGCGRCEAVCPNGAVSITITDSTQVDALIKKIESVVDVEDQGSKVGAEE